MVLRKRVGFDDVTASHEGCLEALGLGAGLDKALLRNGNDPCTPDSC